MNAFFFLVLQKCIGPDHDCTLVKKKQCLADCVALLTFCDAVDSTNYIAIIKKSHISDGAENKMSKKIPIRSSI